MENIIGSLEQALHQFDVRRDPATLEKLIHPDFIEFGRSGTRYDKAAIKQQLLTEPRAKTKSHSQDYQLAQLGPDVVQLTYKSAQQDDDGQLGNYTWRSSIWQRVDDQWQIRFHQGTPTTA